MKTISTLIAVLMFAGFASATEGGMPATKEAPAGQEGMAPAHAEKAHTKKHAAKKHHGKKNEKSDAKEDAPAAEVK